ncbi:beta-ketoacyl-ACP reductase [Alicyclobacillus cellulosilyticus]|uniref:Beta-ketoacyl-ACP reductase n=1 Tax=Alicyclobacillus cellulosilyticus TaxID=1003997 RepID=A0A917NFT6_9BACL|nr:3-oxoacyl-ACP reductase family protein [Alicyclobacillus cellulosilyticus]GGI97065.1 beta-ketoacyl-ACP reductase [Alicyclobacillus cellulosilyticus]
MSNAHAISTTRPLYGQVAIVTGAARGIGRAIAVHLARAGAAVIVNYRRSAADAERVVSECRQTGSRALAVQADVTRPEEVERLVVAATQFGPPHILVHNAGVACWRLLHETSLDDWNLVLSTHLTGAFLCAKAVMPYMLRNRYGRIIHIASIWGMTGAAMEVAYSAAKGGLIAFTKALAKEVAPMGITVNAVAPGAVATEMLDHLREDERAQLIAQTPVGRLGKPDDVAQAVLFLATPSASFITGQVISPNGGLVT